MTDKPWGLLAGVRPAKQLHLLLDKGLGYDDAKMQMQQTYRLSGDKFDLLWRICQTERPVLAESSFPHLFSVYVGIPFCPTRCLYCSFPSHSLRDLGKLRSQFVDTLLLEIEQTGRVTHEFGMKPYSVYVGGGTPTALTPMDLDRIFTSLRKAFPGDWREFTVEAGRPDTLTDEHMAVMKAHLVTRISVNPQTMHQTTLDIIGRYHSPDDVRQAVKRVKKAGIAVLNMDLIVGLPGEDAAMVGRSVAEVVALAPENITVHVFSRKRASRFNENQHRFPQPSAEDAAVMQRAATVPLETLYKPYYLYRQREILGGLENIGYTVPGLENAYNIVMIEERHHILGLGGGATSKFIRPDLSLTNVSAPKDVLMYLQRAGRLHERRKHELEQIKQPR